MKNKTKSTVRGRRKVEVKDLKPRDVVFTSPTSKTPYLVLDVGHPCVLLENLNSHWAAIYHPVNGLYVEDNFIPAADNAGAVSTSKN